MNTLPSNLAFSLRWFSQGNHIDLCIDICNQLGRLLPSEPVGQIIKKSQIQGLLVRGFLQKELIESFGISYWRIRVSDAGKKHFEAHNHD
ncbi:MAG: hypothetical protein MJK15_12560 [Colwellia sp.]|nr:hypothetical protein [Colwellia sp.]